MDYVGTLVSTTCMTRLTNILHWELRNRKQHQKWASFITCMTRLASSIIVLIYRAASSASPKVCKNLRKWKISPTTDNILGKLDFLRNYMTIHELVGSLLCCTKSSHVCKQSIPRLNIEQWIIVKMLS